MSCREIIQEIASKYGGSRNPATGGDAGFNMQYEFSGLAAQGVLKGTEREKYFPFDDAPSYEKDCATWLKVVAGIATAVASQQLSNRGIALGNGGWHDTQKINELQKLFESSNKNISFCHKRKRVFFTERVPLSNARYGNFYK